MKKIAFAMLFVTLFSSFFFVSCIDMIVGLKPPTPKEPQVETMTVNLSWSAVDNANSYLLSINRKSSNQPSRKITFPYEKTVNDTSYQWTAPGPGDYTWKVRALSDKGASRWINGNDFTVDIAYQAPTVSINSPGEGQFVNTLTPTIQWTAQPGTLTQAQVRAFEVDNCQVIISEAGEQIHTGTGVQGDGNNWSYQLPTGVLVYGKTYSLKVIASQEGALEEGEDEISFKAPSGIDLELSETSLYNCGMVTATVTAYNPNISVVALFKKRDSEQDYLQLAPPEGWRELNANRQAVFEIPTNEIGVGDWLIRAQSTGNDSKSAEKPLEIKAVTLTPELSLKMCDRNIENGDYAYVNPDTSLPVTATYTVNIDFDQELSDIISEFYYVFEFAGSDTTMTTSSTYNYDTWQATDIIVTMATECTKVATLTLFGTSVCNQYPTTHVFEPDTLSFTLDAALPEITFGSYIFSPENEQLILPVRITDTKSLCQATLSFFVEKENAQGQQMSGWDTQDVPWGVQTVTIGTGDNQIEGTITYSEPIVYGETTTVDATVLLGLGALDGATLTTTVNAIDCCGECINVCSEDELRQPVSDAVSVFFDNTFYKKESINISFYDSDDFADLGESWLLTSQNLTGLASFCFADAYIDDMDDLEATLTGAVDAVSPDGTDTIVYDVVAECTGYPYKNEIHILMSLTAIQGTETSVEVDITGTDKHWNSTELNQHIIIDTQPPKLDSADGHLGQKAGNSSDDYVELAFRVSDKGQMPTFEGATVTVDGNENKKQWYEFLGSVYDYEDQRGIVRLNEDHQFRVNFDESSYSLNEGGSVSIEINASDKYGNTGYTSITGVVYNP